MQAGRISLRARRMLYLYWSVCWSRGVESQPQPACKINTPEATAGEWEVPFLLDKDVGKAKGCTYLLGVMWIPVYDFEHILADDLQDLQTNFFSVDLARLCIWVKGTAANRWGRIAHWNFYSNDSVRGASWSPELCHSSPSQWNNQTCVSWGEEVSQPSGSC